MTSKRVDVVTTVPQFRATVGPLLARDLGLGLRDAVNACALAITKEARAATKAMLGPEQRLSGYLWNPRGGRRVAHEQGRRINPFYLEADSLSHPVAWCRIRGPAQLIEHRREGGYVIKPRHKSEALSVSLFDIDIMTAAARPGAMRRQIEKSRKRPALLFANGNYRAQVKGGPIEYPRRPITTVYRRAPVIIHRFAVATMVKRLQAHRGR